MAEINLNSAQKRYLRASLYSFEKSLREIDQILTEGDVAGILFERRLALTAAQREQARDQIAQALQTLASFAHRLGLERSLEDPARIVMAEMSVSWANLEDCRPKRLKSYGELSPEIAREIDPAIDQLVNIAMKLTRLIPVNPDLDDSPKNK